MATKVLRVDLDRALPTEIEGAERFARVWVVPMRSGVPVGRVIIENDRTPVLREQLRSEILHQLADKLIPNLEPEPAGGSAPVIGELPSDASESAEGAALLPALKPEDRRPLFLSIVVCTRNRPEDLRKCLTSLSALTPGRHQVELIVVDNDPSSGQTEPVVRQFAAVRYETEPRPGVAYARNEGLRRARGDVVAYIDDDIVVPDGWVQRILAPFADSRVMCVTGLVLPVGLDSESEELFEEYGALGRGYEPRVFDRAYFHRSRRHCVHTWELGGTANVAIRKSVISESGMFDETLGPGLPTGVGEDIYMFYRILKCGHLCYYEPAAYVWHKHRADMAALHRQLYNYSKGQTSYQLRTLVSDGDPRALWQLLVNLPMWHAARILRVLRGRKHYPLGLIWTEIRGNLAGPLAFRKSIAMHRRLNGGRPTPVLSELDAPVRG